MPARTAARQPPRTTTKRAPTKPKPGSVDELADTLASGLTISKGKGKQDVPVQTPEEQRISAMREMNATMQGLTGVVQSGWKASVGMPPSAKAKEAVALANSARSCLSRLRVLSPDDLDVERAASSVVGKLVALELYQEALDALTEVRAHLLVLCGHTPISTSATLPSTSGRKPPARPVASKRPATKDYLEQLSLPLPSPEDPELGTDLLTMISTYFSHVLAAFTSHAISPPAGDNSILGETLARFASILHNSPTLIAWIPQLSSIPSSHLNSVLTRAYTALTKSSSRAQNYPREVFCIRHYALLCLLYTAPSTIDSSTFWDQAVKFAVAFARATPALWLNGQKSRPDELAATNLVLSVFSDVLTHAEKRGDASAFLSGKSFIAFCDYWLGFAKKAGNINLLDRIAGLMHAVQLSPSPALVESLEKDGRQATSSPRLAEGISTPTSSRPSSPSKAKQRSTGDKAGKLAGATLQMTKLGVSFVQACTFIETLDSIPVSEEEYNRRMRDTVSAVGRFRNLLPEMPSEADEEEARTQGKMERALERLRRAALKVLDKPSSVDRSSKLMKALLAEIAISLGDAIKLRPHVDFYTSALDTYFTLARTSLVPSDPRTHEISYDFLSNAAAILGLELNASHEYSGDITRPTTIEEETFANYVRCLSGAFHNLAGTLYQAEKHGTTIRFLRQSCVLGKLALRFEEGYSRSRREDANVADAAKAKREEAWKQLEEQITRRWELLGVCYSKIADRKLACDAFVESVTSYVFPKSFVQAIKTTGPGAVFDAFPALKQIGTMIDRITYMATCELLRDPADVSLKRRFDRFPVRVEDGQVESQKYVLGAVLERQIESLEGSRWKDGVRSVISALLSDALVLYDAESWPIRRAATMLRCLEFSYYQNQGSATSFADLPLETHEYGEQIELLLSSENLGRDANLASLRSPYQAASHLWLALHCHRIQDARQSQLVIKHVQDACHLLRPLFAHADHANSKSAKSPKQTTNVRKGQTRAAVSRTPAAAARAKTAKIQATKVPVTPRHVKGLEATKAQPPSNQTSVLGDVAVAYESFVKLAELIRMNIHLLGLLGHVLGKVQLLRILRRLCEQYRPRAEDDYMKASIDLAHEYVKLGKIEKAGSIYNQVLSSIRNGSTSNEVKALYFLRYAESLSLVEDVSSSSSIYCEALSLSESLDSDEKQMSTVDKVRARVARLERSALASNAYATIQLTKDDPTAALTGFLQSLRLWSRAMSNLERLQPPTTPAPSSTDSSNPFDVTDLKNALPSNSADASSPSPEGAKVIRPQHALNGLEWRIADGLLTTLFCLTHIYGSRGSVREAEYFANQAHDLAMSLHAPIMICRALARKGELQLQLGELEKGYQTLVAATESLKDVPGPDAADIRRLHAEYNRLNEKDSDARQLYAEAAAILDELNNMFSTMDGYGIRRSTILSKNPRAKTGNDALVPSLVSSVLRQHIWLLRDDVGEEYQALLDKFLALPSSVETKADEHTLVGKLTLHDVYDCFKEDMFLSSLTESAISLPMGMSGSKSIIASSSAQEILETLQDAEKMFWSTLSAIARRGKVSQIREVTGFLALIQAFNTSLGKAQKATPVIVANLLDMSTALTLRREMLEVIQGKFPLSTVSDDLQWPAITSNGSPISTDRRRRRRRLESRSSSDVEDSDDGGEAALDDSWLHEYWASLEKKYRAQSLDAKSLAHSKVDALPKNWTVVTISITDDKSSLFVSRQCAHRAPLVFCLPLKGRREGEGDEHLAFSDAVEELREIIRLSDEGTKQAVHVKNGDKEARAAWWADRAALDKRLQELLENMEFCWLGGFKTILSPSADLTPDALADLQMRLDKVFTRSLVLQSQQDKGKKAQKQRLRLDDALVACFGALSPRCKDEELEDLVYFVLDLYQFHGVQVAIAEVDVDQVVVDLRTALEDHAMRVKDGWKPMDDAHTFLVLDKNVQAFPWESIPVLRGQSVSRVPSLDFLLDRVELVQRRRKREGFQVGVVDRLDFDPRNTYYVLNPSGDLGGTEKRFAGWLESMKAVGWEGLVGASPSEQQILDALQRKDLFIYFGHGGAEQYVRSHKLRHLPRCAATMLWGCSSGLLRDMGEFDRTGTPYNYMLAGCPTLVANLWDVTDRDIDKFSQAVFDEIRLTPERVKKATGVGVSEAEGTSVVEAVAKAREECKLKYLTGAAPVVYGIPFYL